MLIAECGLLIAGIKKCHFDRREKTFRICIANDASCKGFLPTVEMTQICEDVGRQLQEAKDE